jgi:hypothetical protein
MTSGSRPIRGIGIAIALVIAITLVMAACASTAPEPSGGVTPGPTPTSPTAAPSGHAPTPVPVPSPADGSGGGGSQPGGGGSQPGGDTGVTGPDQPGNDIPPGGWPGPEPTIVEPVAGLAGIHPVPATELTASIDGRSVSVLVAWWSGVEPCNVLAGVEVVGDGSTIRLTVLEGSGGSGDLACPELAMYKGTVADLGELEPGDYSITAFGDPAPLTIAIPG